MKLLTHALVALLLAGASAMAQDGNGIRIIAVNPGNVVGPTVTVINVIVCYDTATGGIKECVGSPTFTGGGDLTAPGFTHTFGDNTAGFINMNWDPAGTTAMGMRISNGSFIFDNATVAALTIGGNIVAGRNIQLSSVDIQHLTPASETQYGGLVTGVGGSGQGIYRSFDDTAGGPGLRWLLPADPDNLASVTAMDLTTYDDAGTARGLAESGKLSALFVVELTDGITAPAAIAGKAQLYVDTADGDLKMIFGDGFIAVIAADS